MMPASHPAAVPGSTTTGGAPARGDEQADGGLWPHQQGAVGAAVAYLAGGARCQLVMACGTGKTRTGAEISRQVAAGGKVLVVVPTQELLAQTARVYAGQLGASAGMIGAVCAEPGATAGAAEVRGEMAHLHAGVSTDPGDVAAWLRQPGRATIFTTYASLPAIAAAHDMPLVPGWDLAVVDEAHRAAGLPGRAWSVINDDGLIPAQRRLYMTATPRVMSGDRDGVVSMDDEKVFGPEVFRVSFAQAISQGLLADYRVAVAVVTSAEVAELAAGGRIVSAGGTAVPARMLAAQLALLKAAAGHDLRRIITYHGRVAAAQRFAATLARAATLLSPGEQPPRLVTGSVDGSMRLDQRRAILRHLEETGDRMVVVSNSRVLSEGIDVPELDAVMFADPRDSGTDVVQAVGRALRRGHRESKTATIIIPVLLEETDTTEIALEGSEFGAIWRVVRALRAHDERMAAWLDQARVCRGRRDDAERGPDPGADPWPQWLTVTGAPSGASFAAALQVRIISTGSSPWLDGYARASAWHDQHGHLLVPAAHVTSGGYPLGRWISQQRTFRKQGILPADRIRLLDALAMTWDVHEAAWQDRLSRLRAWHAARGHLDIPLDYTDEDGFTLGAWLNELRRSRTPLTTEQIAALDGLGMAWRMRDYRWEKGLTAARAWHAGHGNLDVPTGYITEDGLRLGSWITGVRRKRDRGTLDAEQIAALDELGMRWSTDRGWTQGLAAARRYHAEHGHINVPKNHPPADGLSLGNWIVWQRQKYRDGTLEPGRIAILEQLGLTWDPGDQAWKHSIAALREYRQAHGHADVPKPYKTPSGFALGKWLARQRFVHNAGTLPAGRTAALDDLGVRWTLRDPEISADADR